MNGQIDSKGLRNTLIGVLVASLLSLGGSYYWYIKGQDERAAAARLQDDKVMAARVADLEKQLALVQESVIPISLAMQALLVKQLTHFHTPVMDALLVKLGPPNKLTEAEEEQLAIALRERAQDMGDKIDASERDAALMLPMIMRRVRAELRTDPKKQRLQTVSLPVEVAEAK